MKRMTLFALSVAMMMAAVSCGGNANKEGEIAENGNAEAVSESAGTPEKKTAAASDKKAEPKKWYEQDFSLTETMYVGNASMTRTYARKGNIVIGTSEGSGTTSLFVCTDSTRTQYLIGNEKGTFIKRGEKTGFKSVDDAIYKYLKDQMSGTAFGDKLKKGEEGTVTKDTTLFGRPAYKITKETKQKNAVIEVSGKTIMYIDKENGLPYYKWGMMKTNDKVTFEGKVFEVTAFSANPTYEGLIVSLDGLQEIKQ